MPRAILSRFDFNQFDPSMPFDEEINFPAAFIEIEIKVFESVGVEKLCHRVLV